MYNLAHHKERALSPQWPTHVSALPSEWTGASASTPTGCQVNNIPQNPVLSRSSNRDEPLPALGAMRVRPGALKRLTNSTAVLASFLGHRGSENTRLTYAPPTDDASKPGVPAFGCHIAEGDFAQFRGSEALTQHTPGSISILAFLFYFWLKPITRKTRDGAHTKRWNYTPTTPLRPPRRPICGCLGTLFHRCGYSQSDNSISKRSFVLSLVLLGQRSGSFVPLS